MNLENLYKEYKELAKNPELNKMKLEKILKQIDMIEKLCGCVLTDN